MKKHFILLDGLRGIAALAVGSLHASQIFEVSASPFPAYLAVDFFFCLSGFVVAFAYDDRLASGMTMFDFSLRRIIRLYPMIIVGVLLGLFSTAGKLTLAGGHELQETVVLAIAAMLLLPAGLIFHLQAFPIDNPIWSLFFEIFANGVYALQKKIFEMKSVKYFVILSIFGLILAALIWRSGSVDTFGFNNIRQFFYGFFRVIFSFFTGVAIFRFSISLGSIRIPAWLTVLSLGCLLLEPFINKSSAYDVFCIGFAFSLIIMFGAALEIRGLSAKIMYILGKVSYPFYIIHQPILRVVHGLMFKLGHVAVPATVAALFGLVVTAGTSYGLLLIYDEPTRSFLTRAALQKSLIKRSSKLPV